MTAAGAGGPALLRCPFPDPARATATAASLLDEGALACANIGARGRWPSIRPGARGAAEEAGVVFKTDAALLSRAIPRVAELIR